VVHSSAVSTSECTTLRTGREDERALMILLDAALPRSGGQRIGRPAHYTIRGAPRRLAPRGVPTSRLPLLCGSLRRAPLAGAAPSHSGSINPSSRFMNCPMGALTPIRRLARLGSSKHGPHMGRTVPRFHQPAESQSASTPRAVDPVYRRGRRLGDIDR
jgi:hypothetical protein